MITAVLFDLDGTLVNSLGDLSAGVNFVLKENGYPTREKDEFKYFVGDGIPKMIERALPENARKPNIKQRLTEMFLLYYSEHFCDTTYAYSGIPELLSELRKRNMKIAVVSNKAQKMAEAVVNSVFGIKFDYIIGKRDGVAAKPDPAAPLLAAKHLAVNPEQCAFLGDSGMDMAAAVRAKMLPVGVLWGFRKADELNLNGAQKLISEPNELLELI